VQCVLIDRVIPHFILVAILLLSAKKVVILHCNNKEVVDLIYMDPQTGESIIVPTGDLTQNPPPYKTGWKIGQYRSEDHQIVIVLVDGRKKIALGKHTGQSDQETYQHAWHVMNFVKHHPESKNWTKDQLCHNLMAADEKYHLRGRNGMKYRGGESSLTSSKKSSGREAELALLQQLTARLDRKIGTTSSSSTSQKNVYLSPMKKTTQSKGVDDLAAKATANSIAKACIEENVSLQHNENKSMGVVDSLIEEFRLEYPTLTKKMVTDAIDLLKEDMYEEDIESDEAQEYDYDAVENLNKFSRCMEIVTQEMRQYHSLKRRREPTTSSPVAKKVGRPRKSPGAAKGPYKKKEESADTKIILEITKRYAKQREAIQGRLPNGAFEDIVAEVKKDLEREDFDLPMSKIKKRVTWHYMSWPDKKVPPKTETDKSWDGTEMMEEIYQRFARAKKAAGSGSLPSNLLDNIISGVKLELGLSNRVTNNKKIESHVEQRFKNEHPETTGGRSNNKKDANDLDEPLVNAINVWLAKGKGVTRDHGLEMAKTLLKGQKMTKTTEADLDPTWWRSFLSRCGHKLVTG